MHQVRSMHRGLARRIRELRFDHYGESDAAAAELAGALGIPLLTWFNYEAGVSMPAEIMLGLLDLTEADPRWLLTGKGRAPAWPELGPSLRIDA